jgi:hypothetical protein
MSSSSIAWNLRPRTEAWSGLAEPVAIVEEQWPPHAGQRRAGLTDDRCGCSEKAACDTKSRLNRLAGATFPLRDGSRSEGDSGGAMTDEPRQRTVNKGRCAMVGPRLSRAVGIMGIVILVVVAVLSAQAPPSAPSDIADLLAEVRGLRADVNRAAGASMRTQLLVARVSLQEQRINAVVHNLTDVQAPLTTAIRERTDVEDHVKRLGDVITARNLPAAELRDVEENMLPAEQAHLAQRRATEQQLRSHETELSSLLASEQNRWTDLNNRLDELERAIPLAEQR